MALAVTGGGWVFDGDVNGRFRAFDDRNGESSGSSASARRFPASRSPTRWTATISRLSGGQSRWRSERAADRRRGGGPSAFESPCRVIRAVCGAGEAGVELPVASVQPPIESQGDVAFNPWAQCAFPDDCDSPTGLEQVASVASVPFGVRIELRSPELLAGGRHGGVPTASVSVPETAVDEADGVEPEKHEVWSTRESSVVQTVSEPAGVDGSTKSEFRLCVPASDPRHYARPCRAVHGVGHRCPSKESLEARCRQQTTREVRHVPTRQHAATRHRTGRACETRVFRRTALQDRAATPRGGSGASRRSLAIHDASSAGCGTVRDTAPSPACHSVSTARKGSPTLDGRPPPKYAARGHGRQSTLAFFAAGLTSRLRRCGHPVAGVRATHEQRHPAGNRSVTHVAVPAS